MKWILVFALAFWSIQSYSQNASVIGSVINASTKAKIDLATVVLKSVSDSTKIFGGKTNENGSFILKNVPFGKYSLKVTSLGFVMNESKAIEINQAEMNVGKISLQENKKSLSNVTVTGEKATIQMAADKKVFNVDKNITSTGGTAEDVLRNIPSVSVDMDGNVSLRGKDNVNFLVDGKPSAMFGSDVQTALQTIPASSIESIEVMTNPSSKYDAQGMSGLINIVLKKDKKPGYNGMINLGIAAPFKLNGGVNFNANVKKWNVFINANGRTARTWEKTTTRRDNYENTLTYSSYTHNDRTPLNGFINAGFDYSVNSHDKISFTQSLFSAKMKGNSLNSINNEIDYTTLLNRQVRRNIYTGMPLNSTSNLQWNHKFKKPKEELNVETNFSTVRYIRKSTFENTTYDANLNYLSSYVQQNPIRGGNYNGTIQLDYTRPLFKEGKLEIGAKSYFIQFKSENQPTRQNANEPVYAEPVLKNHFIFNQQIHSAYTNLFNQYKNTSIQLGLRAEYFTYKGTIYQYNASASNDYLSLFPTLFINHKLKENQDITLNYSRRVNRPDFRQLIPFIDVSNPQDTSQGNANLKAEFIHSTELGYNYKYGNNNSNNMIVSAYYQYTNDLIQRYRRFNTNGTTYSQNRNLATGQTYGIELINKHNINEIWDVTTSVNLFRNKIDGSNVDSTLTRAGYGGFVKCLSNTKLSKTLNIQVVGNYYAPTVISQGVVKSYGNIDLALKKTFMKNMANLTLNINDLFNTIQTKSIYTYFPIYNQEVLRKNQTRSIGLNLQVRFASKSMRNQGSKAFDAMKKNATKGKSKVKETKSRDENLKKDDGDGEEGGGGNK